MVLMKINLLTPLLIPNMPEFPHLLTKAKDNPYATYVNGYFL